jgi:predicted metal-dependent phosphoesterase TrpH
MIDLHMHSYYSDGTNSPGELVRMSKEKGMSTISLTDHDGIDGVAEAVLEGDILGVKVVPGIEISVSSEIKGIHILGYGIDIYNPEFQLFIKLLKQYRRERNAKFMQEFERLEILISENDLSNENSNEYWGKPHFAQILKNRGLIENAREAFSSEKYFRSDSFRKIIKQKPLETEGIEAIRKSGGFAVLAHPGLIVDKAGAQIPEYELSELIKKLKSFGLAGVECYYSEHTEEFTRRILKITTENGLFPTAGSDFHGLNSTKESKANIGLPLKYAEEIETLKFPF